MRRLLIECLEARLPLTAEGSPYALDVSVETAGILGNVSAEAVWGDGSSTPLQVSSAPGRGSLVARFDYTYDTTGFFNDLGRRQILQAAADIVFSKFSDQLAAITPAGNNRWTQTFPHPSTGQQLSLEGGNIAANELVIYAGARDLPENQVAVGGPGGYGWRGTAAWGQVVAGRGQPNATGGSPTDFATWGGSLTVDPTVQWHLGSTTDGLTSQSYDFLSAVSHEIVHILGFGVSGSWNRLVSGNVFVGANSVAAYGGPVPLSGELSHWREGTASSGQEALMDPSLNNTGIRKLPTPLDLAGLADMGWSLVSQQARVAGSHTYGDNGNYPIEVIVIGDQAGRRTIPVATAAITNQPPTLVQGSDRVARQNSPLLLTNLGIFEDPGFGNSESFQYEIDWGDGSAVERGTATIDRVGSPGVKTAGSFDGSHTYAQTGSFRVRYRVTDDDGGSDEKSLNILVSGPPQIQLTLDREAVDEDAGANAASLQFILSGIDPSLPTTLSFTSSDLSEASIVPSIILPAGVVQGSVPINAVDDALLDGTQSVQLTAQLGSEVSAAATLQVRDREWIQLSLNPLFVREDAGPGAAVLRVTRSDVAEPTARQIFLSSSNELDATLPPSVLIPAGTAFIDVSITAVDDSELDGAKSVFFSAAAAGFSTVHIGLTCLDYEPIQWVAPNVEIHESPQSPGQTVALTVPGPVGVGGAVFSLQVNEANQIQLPASVTLAQGQQSVLVLLQPLDDAIVEGNKLLQVTATSQGYVSATLNILLIDDDRSPWTNSSNIYDVDGSQALDPIDVLQVINFLERNGPGTLPPNRDPLGPPYADVNGDGIISPIDVLIVINALQRSAG